MLATKLILKNCDLSATQPAFRSLSICFVRTSGFEFDNRTRYGLYGNVNGCELLPASQFPHEQIAHHIRREKRLVDTYIAGEVR